VPVTEFGGGFYSTSSFPQHCTMSPDENAADTRNGFPTTDSGHTIQPQTPSSDSYLMISVSLEPTTTTFEDEESPKSLELNNNPLTRSQSDLSHRQQQHPFKAQFYQTLRNWIWIFPFLLVILVPAVCFAP